MFGWPTRVFEIMTGNGRVGSPDHKMGGTIKRRVASLPRRGRRDAAATSLRLGVDQQQHSHSSNPRLSPLSFITHYLLHTTTMATLFNL